LTITSGLVARWESDSITGLSDGDAVSTWTDTSGLGRNATQFTTANKPLFKTNIFGTQPAVRFDGSNDYLSFTPSSIPSFTMFVAWSYLVPVSFSGLIYWRAASQAGFCFQDIGTPSYGFMSQLVITNTSDVVIITKYGGSGVNYDYAGVPIKAVHMNRWNGSTQHFKKNGGAFISYATDGYASWSTLAHIGHGYDYCNCDIAAILVYDNALSDSDATTVETYLNTKYPCFYVSTVSSECHRPQRPQRPSAVTVILRFSAT